MSSQASALCFINTLCHTSKKMNIRIFHQQEILAAGFDPDFIERVSVSSLIFTFYSLVLS